MVRLFTTNSQINVLKSTSVSRKTQPSSDFYKIFCDTEVLRIIQAIESSREIPLKYFYKGRGSKIWDNFYLKYIIPKWYRSSNVEVELLQEIFGYINHHLEAGQKINIIDVGVGNVYPVKNFITRFNRLDKIEKYLALDISEELLKLSRANFQKWFPTIEFNSNVLDIEHSCIPSKLFDKNPANSSSSHINNVILHLGVTIGNHRDRMGVWKNFRNSMEKNDLLIFTNELGSSSSWDGKVRGGCDYHAGQIYQWIKDNLGIIDEDCQLVRKYDSEKDSVVANIQFRQNYTLDFSLGEIGKTIEISAGEEITIWRHHKHQISELIQETQQSGLKLVHYVTNKYSSHVMGVCQI